MKPALYINACNYILRLLLGNPSYFSAPIPISFYLQPFHLGDRAEIETDESKLQILPYLNVINHRGEVFCYYRGGKGEEGRLHGALSIGLGGHIDSLPSVNTMPVSHFKAEAARELEEELGVKVDLRDFEFAYFLIDRSNPVGRVHLGLRCVINLPDDSWTFKAEEGVIEKGFWQDPRTFTKEQIDSMENWSKLCVSRLLEELPPAP